MITLQTAGLTDYENIARLHAANWRNNYRGILSDDFLDKKVERFMMDSWREKLRLPRDKQYTTIAYRNTEIAGFSCMLIDDDPVFGSMLDNLHVAENSQNQGVGRLLMKNCADLILNYAANRKMYLWVYLENKNAIAVYDRWGGRQEEAVEKLTAEDTMAFVYRYTWNDISIFR